MNVYLLQIILYLTVVHMLPESMISLRSYTGTLASAIISLVMNFKSVSEACIRFSYEPELYFYVPLLWFHLDIQLVLQIRPLKGRNCIFTFIFTLYPHIFPVLTCNKYLLNGNQ